MRLVQPQVFLVARPSINFDGMREYLEYVGADEYIARAGRNDASPGAQLIEFMGRLCYRSWEPGLNPNVTKVREDTGDYLLNVLKSAHGSVLEHASYSFVIVGSRVFTHELVRHRAGTAFSQESMRFVRLTDIPMVGVEEFLDDPVLNGQITHLVSLMEAVQANIAHKYQLDVPSGEGGPSFAEKKRVTSKMRRFAPDGVATVIGFTANVRSLRWLTQLRTDAGAEEEIRYIFDQIGCVMEKEEPLLWQDFDVDADGQWVAANRKV